MYISGVVLHLCFVNEHYLILSIDNEKVIVVTYFIHQVALARGQRKGSSQLLFSVERFCIARSRKAAMVEGLLRESGAEKEGFYLNLKQLFCPNLVEGQKKRSSPKIGTIFRSKISCKPQNNNFSVEIQLNTKKNLKKVLT